MNNAYPYPPTSPAPQGELDRHIPAARRAYNRVGLGMMVFILVPQLLSVVIAIVTILAFPAFYESVWYIWFNQILCLYMIAAPLTLLVIGLPRAGHDRYEKKPMSPLQLLVIFCIMETVAVIGSIVSSVLMSIVSAITGGEYNSPLDEVLDGAPWWIMLLVVGIIGPIIEELICRRAIMRRLLPFGEKSAIVFSAVIFGLMHGNFYQLFYAVGLGLILGYVYARTNNILYPALLHVVFNSLSCLQSIVLQGVDIDGLYEITGLQAQMEWLGANLLPFLGMMAFTLLIYGLAIAGFILLCILYHRIRFEESPYPLPTGSGMRAWLGNPGMILFFVTSFLLMGLTLLPT
ncbi:MAG: CPBP family intramembrane metalloprotease [Clostridia bacterium]|nr:CPBP family intramembrane metalloprotease [Clostridia bacterium]